jgi:hypothetical protein
MYSLWNVLVTALCVWLLHLSECLEALELLHMDGIHFLMKAVLKTTAVWLPKNAAFYLCAFFDKLNPKSRSCCIFVSNITEKRGRLRPYMNMY